MPHRPGWSATGGNDAVNDHDFRSQDDGIASSTVYDLRASFVVVGTSRHPRLRCRQLGGGRATVSNADPDASELLVLADSGGSNGPRIRCFKYALQTRLVDPYQLRLSVCHYPSGASKWNPIDHRLFSEISKNWAGHPLRCYQTILNGHGVTAQLVDQEYPKGVKISDNQFDSIALERHQLHRTTPSVGPEAQPNSASCAGP